MENTEKTEPIFPWVKWVKYYKIYKRYFWGVAAAFVMLCFVLYCVFSSEGSSSMTHEEMLDKAIAMYEAKSAERHGKTIKIYPYGKECLRKATIGCSTTEDIYQIILANEKWFVK